MEMIAPHMSGLCEHDMDVALMRNLFLAEWFDNPTARIREE